ncbi:hypothetical protein [Latilactobacillus sakei]|uniref:hypothetical protein n=1 Tax=Latilactobacillus sakei TaxID=1599 RepID=UPI000DC64A4B|nr:hypothetical protein [Latilactobacillus sakei]SPS07136.1 hypothetical protein LAS9624_01386 [Latilactobacillus sakei]
MTKKLESYLSLLDLSYIEAVKLLLVKYGPSVDDYFREKSYERFLNGEILNILKGNTSRSKEGLFCHHIDENKYLSLGKKEEVRRQKAPFSTQRQDRLVYCDLIEHAILHILIAKETDKKF